MGILVYVYDGTVRICMVLCALCGGADCTQGYTKICVWWYPTLVYEYDTLGHV